MAKKVAKPCELQRVVIFLLREALALMLLTDQGGAC